MGKKFDATVFAENFSELQAHVSHMESSYPLDYQRVDNKTEPVIKVMDHLAGGNVVDIGSNFGMFSLLLGPITTSVIGLERSPEIHNISNSIKEFFTVGGYDLENVSFLNKSLKGICELDYDSLLMTLVLYHLSNDEVDLLVEDAAKKCDRVLIQCRPGRGTQFHSGKLTDHVSRNDRFNGLYDIAGNIMFLKEIGMKKIEVTVSTDLFGTEVFPVIAGKK